MVAIKSTLCIITSIQFFVALAVLIIHRFIIPKITNPTLNTTWRTLTEGITIWLVGSLLVNLYVVNQIEPI